MVIGGGYTGTDCVATALRHGCKSLVQLEIVPMPPLERTPDNPWPQWPKIYRMDYGQEEAQARWGSDPRRYAVQTKSSPGKDGFRKSTLSRWNGSAIMAERRLYRSPGTEQVLPAQLVLLARGFSGRESLAFGQVRDR